MKFKEFMQTRTIIEETENPDNPYNVPPCPICGKYAIGSCRCPGPHSLKDLKEGHGLRCSNGHHFAFDPEPLAYDPNEKKKD